MTAAPNPARRPTTSKPARPGPGPQLVRGQVNRRPGNRPPVRDVDVTWATFGYLSAILLGPLIPLVVYLISWRRSPFMRYHAARALNLSLTWTLYGVCCVIIGGLLVLDSLTVALLVAVPIAVVLWLAMLKQIIRGIGAAGRGERYEVPSWICAQIAR